MKGGLLPTELTSSSLRRKSVRAVRSGGGVQGGGGGANANRYREAKAGEGGKMNGQRCKRVGSKKKERESENGSQRGHSELERAGKK